MNMSSQALTLSISKPVKKWFPYSIMKKKKKEASAPYAPLFRLWTGKKKTEHVQNDEILTH